MSALRLLARIALFPVWIIFKFLLMWIHIFSLLGFAVAGLSIFVMAIAILMFIAQGEWLLLASVLTGGFIVFLAVLCGGGILLLINKVDNALSDLVFN